MRCHLNRKRGPKKGLGMQRGAKCLSGPKNHERIVGLKGVHPSYLKTLIISNRKKQKRHYGRNQGVQRRFEGGKDGTRVEFF